MNETETPRREIIDNPDGTATDYTYFEPAEETMRVLVDRLFKEHWAEITVGPCIEGAVFEIRFKEPPKVSLLDGYLTVDLGHFTGTSTSASGRTRARPRPCLQQSAWWHA